MRCEGCGAIAPTAPGSGITMLFDFCVHCSRNLCSKCMTAKPCDERPAGNHQPNGEDE